MNTYYLSQWTLFQENAQLHSATFYAAWTQILHYMAPIIVKMEQHSAKTYN